MRTALYDARGIPFVAVIAAALLDLQEPKPTPTSTATTTVTKPADLEARVTDLERRVAALEQSAKPGAPAADPAGAKADARKPDGQPDQTAAFAKMLQDLKAKIDGPFPVPVSVTNKRLDTASVDDSVWMDLSYDFKELKKPTRAIKGFLAFCDLFGERKFQLNSTISVPLAAGATHAEKGVGFSFNQFRDSHKWMASTDPKDMVVTFRVEQIIYADGAKEDFK
ncbi:MAG: hypothetical protein WAT39_00095 [Planctomycetota bacterium]